MAKFKKKTAAEMTELAEQSRLVKLNTFIDRLAVYLVGDQAMQSVKLQAGDPHAQVWADIRSATPLFGYPTIDEAKIELRRFFGVK